MYERSVNLLEILRKKSLVLLGPRQTGKSTLIRALVDDTESYNLAESETFRTLTARPELIRLRLRDSTKILVIDEAQKVPELFDEAQVLLDRNPNLRIVLTGSSARKLKRGKINLLPGRVWKKDLHPLVYPELGALRLDERLQRGSLPGIIDSPDFKEELRNYVGLYLAEEIQGEGLVRGIGSFSRFIDIAALHNSEQISFANIANDSGVKAGTVKSFFQILEDTLIGHILPSFRDTRSRKATAAPKFYFFDTGVVNAIQNQFEISEQGPIFGKALEHLIFLELKAYLSYTGSDASLTFWRSTSKMEVDFVIDSRIAIEVKASTHVSWREERGLHALSEDLTEIRKIIVCREATRRRSESGVEIFPVEEFLQALWKGEFA